MPPKASQTDDMGDYRLMVRFILPVAPRTKKNHGNIVIVPAKGTKYGYRGMMLPSPQYKEYEKACLDYIREELPKLTTLQLEREVNVAALFYRDRASGDTNGYYQALADMMEKAGILANDVWIKSWEGSYLLKDANHPRTVVTITPYKGADHV